MIGLGAGVVPRWYEEQGVRTDVVDINPAVVDLARSHFGYDTAGRVFVSDARSFLRESTERYDYMILDVFNGDTTPSHLMSLEAFRLMRERLSPRGVLAINLIGAVAGRGAFATASIVRTIGEIFPEVRLFPGFGTGATEGNITVVAGAALGPLDPSRLPLAEIHPHAIDGVLPYLRDGFRFPEGTPSIVLSDDYNPLDLMELALKEQERRAVLSHADWDLIL